MARTPKQVETLRHDEARRVNIPTAELQSFAENLEERDGPPRVSFPRARPLAGGQTRPRDPDLDPQIVWNGVGVRLTQEQRAALAAGERVDLGDAQLAWRGKDQQDWSDLVVVAPPLYIQEKIHPKAIIDDLKRRSRSGRPDSLDLFADFNGLDPAARTEFYQHDQHWSNRMILGDSLQVMASLAERERLAGKVQAIYFDPPYGIRFNSNWQVSTQSRDVKDGKLADITREPEQVKAFRDTWKEGIHSYLTYLRDRLTVMRELLTESGSIFVQIGDENVHRVRAVMDEVFGEENFASLITYKTSIGLGSDGLDNTANYIVWFFCNSEMAKFRAPLRTTIAGEEGASRFKTIRLPDLEECKVDRFEGGVLPEGARLFRDQGLTSRTGSSTTLYPVEFRGKTYRPNSGGWCTAQTGMSRTIRADRILKTGHTLSYRKYYDDFAAITLDNIWSDVSGGVTSRADPKIYVVQTGTNIVQRCLLMVTDPGDLVLDPTCGSGTTAFVAEQWGRRWVTLDTSRVALALARTRLMAARYPWYLLADSPEGRRKEGELTGRPPVEGRTLGDLRQGFVYERAPHVTLRSIANNAEIDVIWERWQETLEPLRGELNALTGSDFEEWRIPHEAPASWSEAAKATHAAWWEARIARQKEIDASIARRADVELLYDRPYIDKDRVRVAGPFTVESLSPHRVVPSDADALSAEVAASEGRRRRDLATAPGQDFAAIVIENLRTAGVQQAHKADRIRFLSLAPWPGEYIAAEGAFMEGEVERRAAVFIGPEFGTVARPDLTAAAREASEARFDVLIAAAFSFEAYASELTRLGALTILKAKINPDLHMAGELKNTGKGNLFVVFGEPDVEIDHLPGDELQVRIRGIDVFDPNTGDIRSGETDSIAAWFIDTDYDEESFFVRHAYFLGANDPYKSLKTALKAEIDEEAWASLYRDVSRPFARPTDGRIAVKVINHFGDEVMKVFRV